MDAPVCKVGGVRNFAKVGILTSHINYGKPHVGVDGRYDGTPIVTCKYCGVRMAKTPSASGLPLGADQPTNVALQRPTVNLKESENVAESVAAQAERMKQTATAYTFSKHGTFHANRTTHPGIE